MKGNQISLQLKTELDLIPRDLPSQRVLELAIKAPLVKSQAERPVLNLALVIDRSGSMGGGKLNYVIEAASHVLDMLQENDTVSIVDYDDEIHTIAAAEKITTQSRQKLKTLLSALHPGGSTNLSGGWLTGCQYISEKLEENRLNRCMLLTDGLANCGIVDLEELGFHAKQLHQRGIVTSTFGVGLDYNEFLFEQMASQGGGNFYFIESPMLIPQIFIQELKDLSAVSARFVELFIEIPSQVDVQVLGGWENSLDNNKLCISIGDLVSNLEQEVYLKVLFPPQGEKNELNIGVKVLAKGEEGIIYEQQEQIVFRYEDKSIVHSAPVQKEILERYSAVNVAEVANKALNLERNGEGKKASVILQDAIQESAPYLPTEVSDHYTHLSDRFKEGLVELDHKQTHFRQ